MHSINNIHVCIQSCVKMFHVGLQSTPESYVVFDTSSYFKPSRESGIRLRFCSL